MLLLHLQSALGIVVILAAAWAFSENRHAFPVRTVAVGFALQIALALLLLKVPVARNVLFSLNGVVDALAAATKAGTSCSAPWAARLHLSRSPIRPA
jgi:CNT family concentrative nucleoside transporter